MHIGVCVLEVSFLGINDIFNVFGGFIVHLVKLWLKTPVGEIFVCLLVGAEEFLFCAIFDGDGCNEVGVINVEDDEICIATI